MSEPKYLDDVSYQSGFEDGVAAERARQADPVGLREALAEIEAMAMDFSIRPSEFLIRASRIATTALASLPAQAVEPGPLDVERTIYTVKYGNYYPAEIESVWATKEQAEAEADRLNDEPGSTGMWGVGRMTLRSPDKQPKGAG